MYQPLIRDCVLVIMPIKLRVTWAPLKPVGCWQGSRVRRLHHLHPRLHEWRR